MKKIIFQGKLGTLSAIGLFASSFLFIFTSSSLYAGITVSGGASIIMNDSTIILNCLDIDIESGGTINVGDGTLESVCNLSIDSGGDLIITTGDIEMNGTFTLDGIITIGSGIIDFTEDCGTTNQTGGTGDYDGDGTANGDDNDDDSDGMSDAWEIGYALNFLYNDAAEDADGDGYTNLQEYREGTDPTDSTDKPFPWEIFYPAFIKKNDDN